MLDSPKQYWGVGFAQHGSRLCSEWVPHFSFGFLLENVIFNLLWEKKRILVLLLLEGLLNALECPLALCTACDPARVSKSAATEQVRDCQLRD